MNIYNRLRFLALGGKKSYLHKNGKENVKTTELQNFLDKVPSSKEFIKKWNGR